MPFCFANSALSPSEYVSSYVTTVLRDMLNRNGVSLQSSQPTNARQHRFPEVNARKHGRDAPSVYPFAATYVPEDVFVSAPKDTS